MFDLYRSDENGRGCMGELPTYLSPGIRLI